MLVLLSPVPLITEALDGQSSIDAIDDQVDALPGCLDLRADRVLPPEKLHGDIDFEPALIGPWLVIKPSWTSRLTFQMVEILGEPI
jgi:hypothetical protein